MRSSTCIIRCTLDNMFRNSKQVPSSPLRAAGSTSQSFGSSEATLTRQESTMPPGPPPSVRYLGGAAGYADNQHSILRTHAEDGDEGVLPKCRQFLDLSDQGRCALQSLQDAFEYEGCSSVNNVGMDRSTGMDTHQHAPSKAIREYDFLRCIDEGSCAKLHDEDIDCTLHLGRASTIQTIGDRNAAVVPSEGIMPSSMRPASSKQHNCDKKLLPSPDGALPLCQRDFRHLNFTDGMREKDNAGPTPWGTGISATMWRTESTGMSTLLRQDAHDMEECGNSSRTSSNSSGNTIKTSATTSESSIMNNYTRARGRDHPTAANFSSNNWLQYNDHGNFAGPLPNSKPTMTHEIDHYLNLSAHGGPFPPRVFSGTKNSNIAKESSNYVIRICAQCKTMRTPLWRNGPQGPKSLCNACGIRYKKEERRSAAVVDNKHQQVQQREANVCADQPSRFNMDLSNDNQRPRSSVHPTEDQRSRLSVDANIDGRSRFMTEDRRPRLSMDPSEIQRSRFTLDVREDQRPRFNMDPCEIQRCRYTLDLSKDERPGLSTDQIQNGGSRFMDSRAGATHHHSEKRPKLANDYRPIEP